MNQLRVDFENVQGKIKAMHGVGQPPWIGMQGKYLHYLSEAHIPYSRLHDMGGGYGGMVFVDIPNIFRDFSADADDPQMYDFAFTDVLIKALMEHNCKPIYRLGVTIENYIDINRYRIFPPESPEKWAKICEMIIRHYTEGWADGFHYDIEYWEIWNEPDSYMVNPEKSQMWYGTAEEYYHLYTVASKHLKQCFGDKIKVGGYAAVGFCATLADPQRYGADFEMVRDEPIYRNEQYRGFMDFFAGFMEHIRREQAPLDFFSWHSYEITKETLLMQDYLEKRLEEYGYGDVEIQLNEWNNACLLPYRGTSYASASAAEMMCCMQHTKADILCYYDARIGPSMYGGLFNPANYEPYCTYYSFKAFGELYRLGNEVSCSCGDIICLAAVSDDGKEKAVLLVNREAETKVTGIPEGMKAYLIDAEHLMEELSFETSEIDIKQNQVVLLQNF